MQRAASRRPHGETAHGASCPHLAPPQQASERGVSESASLRGFSLGSQPLSLCGHPRREASSKPPPRTQQRPRGEGSAVTTDLPGPPRLLQGGGWGWVQGRLLGGADPPGKDKATRDQTQVSLSLTMTPGAVWIPDPGFFQPQPCSPVSSELPGAKACPGLPAQGPHCPALLLARSSASHSQEGRGRCWSRLEPPLLGPQKLLTMPGEAPDSTAPRSSCHPKHPFSAMSPTPVWAADPGKRAPGNSSVHCHKGQRGAEPVSHWNLLSCSHCRRNFRSESQVRVNEI